MSWGPLVVSQRQVRGPVRAFRDMTPFEKAMDRALTAGARVAATEARKAARKGFAQGRPRPTGELARTIRARNSLLIAGRDREGFYGRFLELGWRSGARRVGTGEFRFFRGRIRERTRVVDKSGQRLIRYPFLLPAVDRSRGRVLQKVSENWFRQLERLDGP